MQIHFPLKKIHTTYEEICPKQLNIFKALAAEIYYNNPLKKHQQIFIDLCYSRESILGSLLNIYFDKQTPYFVNWSIKARGHPFSSGGRTCDLCLTEKLVILTADQNSMLNKRDELLETCRHRRKHLLVSLFKPPEEDEPPDTTIK